MAYDERTIDELHALNDVVDVISSYIPLKRAGRAFKACCPFHQEKTPSFHVNPNRQIFHCFGCSEGGDVISFIMKYEKLTFPEAVQLLARRVNMVLPESDFKASVNSLSKTLYQMYEHAQVFYHEQFMKSAVASQARAYWKSRGLGAKDAAQFKIGYASADWQVLLEFMIRKGYQQDILLKSGLIARSQQGKIYDWFRNRLLFPILNSQGRTIAFGGRVLNDEIPKYLNSPETEIFRKRREFYGLSIAKTAMLGQGGIRRMLVVEGYMDCIQLHAHGFLNTVATLGTALSEDHARVLKRYADEAVLVYDGDQAGIQAALRSSDVFLEEGLSARAIGLPSGMDPDDFLRKNGQEAFQKEIDQAQDIFDFKLEILLKRYNKADSSGLLRITSEFLDSLTRIKNQVLLDRYLRRLAGTLGVEERSLRVELEKLKRKRSHPMKQNQVTLPKANTPEPAHEKMLVGFILHYPPYFAEFKKALPQYQFLGTRTKELFQLVAESFLRNVDQFSCTRFISQLRDQRVKAFASELLVHDWEPEDREKGFHDCLLKMQQLVYEQDLRALRGRIGQAEQVGDQSLVAALMQEYKELLACSKVKSTKS